MILMMVMLNLLGLLPGEGLVRQFRFLVYVVLLGGPFLPLNCILLLWPGLLPFCVLAFVAFRHLYDFDFYHLCWLRCEGACSRLL